MAKNNKRVRSELRLEGIARDLHRYTVEHGRFPDTLSQIESVAPRSIVDGWGRPFRYSVTDGFFSVCSYGRDGVPGGDGLDEDICCEGEEALSCVSGD